MQGVFTSSRRGDAVRNQHTLRSLSSNCLCEVLTSPHLTPCSKWGGALAQEEASSGGASSLQAEGLQQELVR